MDFSELIPPAKTLILLRTSCFWPLLEFRRKLSFNRAYLNSKLG